MNRAKCSRVGAIARVKKTRPGLPSLFVAWRLLGRFKAEGSQRRGEAFVDRKVKGSMIIVRRPRLSALQLAQFNQALKMALGL
jgi:hypothetical protein